MPFRDRGDAGHRLGVALEQLRAERPVVLALPRGGVPVGYEVARHIRSTATAAAPLMIALTGYGQAEDVDRSREAGFDHHFVKPADPRAIQGAIETASAQRPRDGLRTSL